MRDCSYFGEWEFKLHEKVGVGGDKAVKIDRKGFVDSDWTMFKLHAVWDKTCKILSNESNSKILFWGNTVRQIKGGD